jgi:DNA-binding phage protein
MPAPQRCGHRGTTLKPGPPPRVARDPGSRQKTRMWNVFEPYQRHARPFDFLIVGIISQDRADVAARPKYCCKKPRPSCLLFDDPAQWRAQDWRCLGCGAAWDFDKFPRLRIYGELVERTLQMVDRKRLNADGSEPTMVMNGVTIPRPVHVKLRTRIEKEITVDPTDTDEDYTAEMLSATAVLEHRNSEEKLDALRAAVRAAGIKRTARMSGAPRSKLQAFVNQGTTPQPSTIAKIEAALFSGR